MNDDAYTIEEFCTSHKISKVFLYELWKSGQGPRSFVVGARRLISREAAADWRREREDHTATEGLRAKNTEKACAGNRRRRAALGQSA